MAALLTVAVLGICGVAFAVATRGSSSAGTFDSQPPVDLAAPAATELSSQEVESPATGALSEPPQSRVAEPVPANADTGLDDESLADLVAAYAGLLADLQTVVWSTDDYLRDTYLDGWPDSDGDCLSDRHELLIIESSAPVGFIDTGCRVETGSWQDPYTLEVFASADEVSIDHVVALANAHRTGGHTWPLERRAAFAIDLEEPSALVVSATGVNNAKADSDPTQWLPPASSTHCRYGIDWIRVKWRWTLGVTADERLALQALLDGCSVDDVLPAYLQRLPEQVG